MGHFDYPGKFGAVFASIPGPIFAALYCPTKDLISVKDRARVMYAKDKEDWVLIHSTTISGLKGRIKQASMMKKR